jgi:hypothetical protein
MIRFADVALGTGDTGDGSGGLATGAGDTGDGKGGHAGGAYGRGMVRVAGTTRVARVTGAGSVSRTDERFAIHATDLGILWDGGDGRIFVLFGDTFGQGWGGDGGGPPEADWRCNVLAFSGTRDLSAGMELDSVIERPDGGATQVIHKGPGREVTVIPNTGIEVDGRQYVQYMSVREWGPPGRWRTNYGGIAVSEDGGHTWDKPRSATWSNKWGRDNKFQICAFAKDADRVYLFGTTNGRQGPVYLARVSTSDILRRKAYEYWDGEDWNESEAKAAPVMPGPAGELCVEYNVHFGRWLAMHLDEERAAIVLRSAERLTGPWSHGEVVVSGADYPGLYGGYLHPWTMECDEIYWLLSQWTPYNVFFMRTKLEE